MLVNMLLSHLFETCCSHQNDSKYMYKIHKNQMSHFQHIIYCLCAIADKQQTTVTCEFSVCESTNTVTFHLQ